MNVSIITPTSERPERLKTLYQIIQQQKFSGQIEWLIFDDSYKPSPFFQNLPNVHYFYSETPLNVGEKRSILAKKAIFDVIAHFDDDDYYAPNYLQYVTEMLQKADFFSLSSWFCYAAFNQEFFYWATKQESFHGFILNPVGELLPLEHYKPQISHTKGFGFSYVYKRKIIERVNFNPLKFGEDYDFFDRVEKEGFVIKQLDDQIGLCLKIQHDTNLSRIFPQYRLPPFLLTTFFPEIKNSGVLEC